MAKTAKVTFIIIFLPTLLHDLAASRQVKTLVGKKIARTKTFIGPFKSALAATWKMH